MKLDYQQLREAGALIIVDSYGDRVLIFEEGCEADPSVCEDTEEGVIAAYHVDVAEMLMDILDALADAGIDIDELLTQAQDDRTFVLPNLRIVADGEE